MNKRKLAISAVLVLLVAYAFAAPYITVSRISSAAQDHDAEALAEHIDFPALRQSLKDQFNVAMAKETANQAEEGAPLGAMGTALASMMIDPMIDAFVTPAGLADLMSGNDPTSETPTAGDRRDEPFLNAEKTYESLGKFTVTVKGDNLDGEVKFVLRRRGLGWKLTEILLPM